MTGLQPILGSQTEPCGATDGEVAHFSPGVTGERVEATFAADPRCVGEARRFVTQQLVGRSQAMVRDIVLMVSELTTNCIKHAHSPFSVSLISNHQAICVEITDQGTGTPTRQPLDSQSATGRGLQIVDELADSWGVTAENVSGKTVWFTIEAAPPA